MSAFYNLKFLKDTVSILESEINDLSSWSVYNDDKYIEEIEILKDQLAKLEEKMGEGE
jgi:hypothetical protein